MASSIGRTLTNSNAKELAEWCGGEVVVAQNDSLGVNVPCGGEVKRAMPGNVIVCRSNGLFNIYHKQ